MLARVARHIHRSVASRVPRQRLDLLDFGGGDGVLSGALAARFLSAGAAGVRITLVDIHDVAPPPADPRVSWVWRPDLTEVGPASHDLVVASCTLEHVPAPREVLTGLLGALRPGGVLYARTPYMLPLVRLLALAGRRLDLVYPGHLHHLGAPFWPRFLADLAPELDCELLDSRPSPVQTSLRDHFWRTLAACGLKTAWRLLGDRFSLVGGWEVLVRRR